MNCHVACGLRRREAHVTAMIFLCVMHMRNTHPVMTSSNGIVFRITGPLCGEFTGHRWIPLTKASDAALWCFLWSAPENWLSKQSWGWWFETPSHPLWRHCDAIAMAYFVRNQTTCAPINGYVTIFIIFFHWLHWKLSLLQLPLQPMMEISSKWHFCFSVVAR